MSMTTNALKIVLQDCIGPLCSSQELVEENRSKLQKCFQAIELGLGYQFHTVWHQVLHVIGKMFEVKFIYFIMYFIFERIVVGGGNILHRYVYELLKVVGRIKRFVQI